MFPNLCWALRRSNQLIEFADKLDVNNNIIYYTFIQITIMLHGTMEY